jgi:hypothetical protein
MFRRSFRGKWSPRRGFQAIRQVAICRDAGLGTLRERS